MDLGTVLYRERVIEMSQYLLSTRHHVVSFVSEVKIEMILL